MLIEQPPRIFRALYPSAIFRKDPNEKAVYLTFDDGPIPEVTPWVLDLLAKHGIYATFFMVGDNIRKYPETFRVYHRCQKSGVMPKVWLRPAISLMH